MRSDPGAAREKISNLRKSGENEAQCKAEWREIRQREERKRIASKFIGYPRMAREMVTLNVRNGRSRKKRKSNLLLLSFAPPSSANPLRHGGGREGVRTRKGGREE